MKCQRSTRIALLLNPFIRVYEIGDSRSKKGRESLARNLQTSNRSQLDVNPEEVGASSGQRGVFLKHSHTTNESCIIIIYISFTTYFKAIKRIPPGVLCVLQTKQYRQMNGAISDLQRSS